MEDFEIIQYAYAGKDGVDLKVRWREGDLHFDISVFVPDVYKALDDYSYRVKYAFASKMKDHPLALKQCLMSLDGMFGTANYHYDEFYSAEILEPVKFKSYQTLSSESQKIWDSMYIEQVFHPGGYSSNKEVTVSWKVNSDQFKSYKQIINNSFESPGQSLSRSSYNLPGVQEYVKFPCGKHDHCKEWTSRHNRLHNTIMKLNDSCGWTREEIADWIESLDVDTTFKINTKEIENVEG